MKKVLALAVSSLFLVACGGGGGGDGGSTKLNISEPSLSQISGVWDDSETINEEIDVKYTVIKDYGEAVFYDYYGDSFDKGDDCYYTETSTLTDLGGGVFEVYNSGESYNLTISISDGKLIVDDGEFDFSPSIKSSLQESDFSPLCNQNFVSSRSFQTLKSTKQGRVFGGY